MATLLDNYVQNNFGLFSSTCINQNGLISEDGAFILGFADTWGTTKSKRMIIGSNSITYYQDFISANANRDFDSIDEPGPLIHIFQAPKWAFYPFIAVVAPSSATTNNLLVFIGSYNEDDPNYIEWAAGSNTYLFDDDFVTNFWASCCCCNAALLGFTSCVNNDNLRVAVYDLASQDPYATVLEDSYDYYPIGASFTDNDGESGVIMATQYGGTPLGLTYVPFSIVDGSCGTPVAINVAASVSSGSQSGVDIAYDKTNDRIAFISAFFNADDAPTYSFVWELFISDDGGATWDSLDLDTAGLLGGSSDFEWEGFYINNVRIMAGVEGGFIIGYTRVNSSGYARPYVHKLDYVSSGGTVNNYTVGTAKEVGTPIGQWDADTDIQGPLFFKAPADMWPNIDPIGNVYIGYQLGTGTKMYSAYPQQSSKSTGFAIEKLNENAYPDVESYSYVSESSGTGEIVCDLKILGTPTDHIDYYSNGYAGNITEQVANVFAKEGQTIKINKYVPKDNIYIGGRTGYEEPETYMVKCFVDSMSWNSPNQALNQSDYDDFIDRDLRKIFMPPAFYMEYVEGVSLSEMNQQTSYLCYIDGFTYEIRQVIPRFVKGQIVYWEANLYNVGNFDVWSRGGGQT